MEALTDIDASKLFESDVEGCGIDLTTCELEISDEVKQMIGENTLTLVDGVLHLDHA